MAGGAGHQGDAARPGRQLAGRRYSAHYAAATGGLTRTPSSSCLRLGIRVCVGLLPLMLLLHERNMTQWKGSIVTDRSIITTFYAFFRHLAVALCRIRQAILLVPAAVLLVAATILAPSALASPRHFEVGQSLPPCPTTSWSSLSPSQCVFSGPTSSSWVRGNGQGCGGFYTGTGHPWMTCENSSITVNNFPVVIRHGYWNPEVSPQGFGWAKALDVHNLYIQPIIDTIANALNPTGSNSNRNYEVYHYNGDGNLDQEVIVVADIVDTYFAGNYTQDGASVGVLTGYCLDATGKQEQQCPDWVNSTL